MLLFTDPVSLFCNHELNLQIILTLRVPQALIDRFFNLPKATVSMIIRVATIHTYYQNSLEPEESY